MSNAITMKIIVNKTQTTIPKDRPIGKGNIICVGTAKKSPTINPAAIMPILWAIISIDLLE